MVCLYCSSSTVVKNSRLQNRNNHIWRRRACLSCGVIFTTIERPDLSQSFVVGDNNLHTMEPFNRDRLYVDIYESCKHRPKAIDEAASLTQTIINNLLSKQPGAVIHKQTIAKQAYGVLKRFDSTAATFYAAYHNIRDSDQTTS